MKTAIRPSVRAFGLWQVTTQAAVTLALVIPAPTCLAKKAQLASANTDISNSFGIKYDQDWETPAPKPEASEAKAAREAGQAALEALAAERSFPVRVQTGSVLDRGWEKSTAPDAVPKPVALHFRVKDCAFTIHTGEFTLRQYDKGSDASEGPVVIQDALPAYSTLAATEQQPVMLSAVTELSVEVDEAKREACHKTFGARRAFIGRITLGDSALAQLNKGEASIQTTKAKDASRVGLYLAWDDDLGSLVLQDQVGLSPTVETAVYALGSKTAGQYYLGLNAVLKLDHNKTNN